MVKCNNNIYEYGEGDQTKKEDYQKTLFVLPVRQQQCDPPSASVTAPCCHLPHRQQQMEYKQRSYSVLRWSSEVTMIMPTDGMTMWQQGNI
jgi:hypothetical protein